MISSHKIKMDPSTTTRYAVQIHFDFFGSTEEGINYLHTNFERVFRGDTSLTNICYCEQAHFEVEEKFEKIIDEGPQDGEDLLVEAAEEIAKNNAVKVFIVDGSDYVYPVTNKRSKFDLTNETVKNVFSAISDSDSINEVKLMNLCIDDESTILYNLIEPLGYRLADKKVVLKVNIENCTLYPDAYSIITSTETFAHVRIRNCILMDENALVEVLKNHSSLPDTTLKFIVIDDCNLSSATISELMELDEAQQHFHIMPCFNVQNCNSSKRRKT